MTLPYLPLPAKISGGTGALYFFLLVKSQLKKKRKFSEAFFGWVNP
ncbi:hypothetical protein M23134_01233 [Microscilla marina ATCC 23134]|uniref:Uncharacterized protein n=1 Tax=Microscilla marina ATCC 23134 TaxID=313606 RepID=A1ZFY5_MICM2|nr:hypothetical protein M23134_01233 [Microscilla marina ATCC 23134]